MKYLRVAAIVVGTALACALGQHRAGESMDKSMWISAISVGPIVVNKPFETIIKQEHLTRYISQERIDAIVDSINMKMPPPISDQYVKFTPFVESSRNAYAIGPGKDDNKIARGMMQLTPDAWKTVDTSDYWSNWYIPEKNIEVGMKYQAYIHNLLSQSPYWNQYSDRVKLDYISASFNAGLGTLQNNAYDLFLMPLETRSYITKFNTELFNDSTEAYTRKDTLEAIVEG